VPGSGPFDDAEGGFLPDSKRIGLIDDIPPTLEGQTLVGGAPVTIRTLEEALSRAPRLIAVDGGADAALAAGMVPETVIGDLDSISDAARSAFADRLHHIAEQNSTDFAKALRISPAALTIAVGFIGARVDHFLSCLTEMVRSGANCVLLGEEDCICIAPPSLDLALKAGTRLSLWPMGPVRGTSEGLRWPIDGLEFGPTMRTGTSNEVIGHVRLRLDGPMALILPSDVLPTLLKSLDATPRGAAISRL
jgi:thiamine pyrophosphokinase